jgi:hypothetical protein
MYSAHRSLSLDLPEFSAPPFPRRSYQHHRLAPRQTPTSAAPAEVQGDESPLPPVTRIFGYTVPVFLVALIITVLCAVMADVKQMVPASHATTHATLPASATGSWAYGLRGQ